MTQKPLRPLGLSQALLYFGIPAAVFSASLIHAQAYDENKPSTLLVVPQFPGVASLFTKARAAAATDSPTGESVRRGKSTPRIIVTPTVSTFGFCGCGGSLGTATHFPSRRSTRIACCTVVDVLRPSPDIVVVLTSTQAVSREPKRKVSMVTRAAAGATAF